MLSTPNLVQRLPNFLFSCKSQTSFLTTRFLITVGVLYSFSFLFFFIPFIIFALSILSLLVVTQIGFRGGHMAGSSSPLPTTVRALHFLRDEISAFSSLVDSRRTVLTHARRSQQLILSFIFANKFKISPRRDSNSRTNTTTKIVAFEGYH